MDFKGKIALITGGSSGIGLALARALARRGANLWLLARDGSRLSQAMLEVQRLCAAAGQSCGMLPADVSNRRQVERAVAHVIESDGIPHLVINSAGITYPGYVQDLDLEVFRQLIEINYLGTVYVTKAVLPGMLARGSGHLVNISSLAGLISAFGYTGYAASKFAVRGFSDALRMELKPYGVHVSIVFPPDTDTPQLKFEEPLKPAETRALASFGGLMKPETVAEAILKGVARRRYLILPGFSTSILYFLSCGLSPALFFGMDLVAARARKKVKAAAPPEKPPESAGSAIDEEPLKG